MTISRRQAREWAVQMLSAADVNPPEDITQFIENFWLEVPLLDNTEGGLDGRKPRGKMKLFAEERVTGVLTNLQDIDETLKGLLEHWDLFRLGTIERVVLRLGVWEIRCTDVPAGVIINEAIDLVNWFSSPKSRTLINGVLDKYAKQMRK